MPAPMLICQLVIKNSADSTVFDQSKNIVVPKDALTKASDKEKEDGLMEKELWKKVPGEFQALAAQVPLNGAGGNAAPGNGSDASKTATPDATAAPAK